MIIGVICSFRSNLRSEHTTETRTRVERINGCTYENDRSDGCDQILAINVVRFKIFTIFWNLIIRFTVYHGIEVSLRIQRKQDETGSDVINLILSITKYHRIGGSLSVRRKQDEAHLDFI